MPDKIQSSVHKDHSKATASAIDKVDLYYGDKDPNKAVVISQSDITEIHLYENMFSLLPRLKVVIMDDGNWYNTFTFQIGGKLYLKMTPKPTGDDMTVDPWIDGMFSIQNIKYTTDQESQQYIYEITAIYGAEGLLNNVCVYPKSDMISKTSTDQKNSAEVLEDISGEAGLKFKMKMKNQPSDKMAWVNGTKTYSEFMKHVVNHAWIEEGDMPLLFANKEGEIIYDSLNRLTSEPVKANFMLDERYKQVSNSYLKDKKDPPIYTTYSNLEIYNLGILQHYGAFKMNSYVYNPYNESDMDKKIYKPMSVTSVKQDIPSFRKKEISDDKIRLAKISNKSAKSVNNISFNNSKGIYFKGTHENYDSAPLHHANIKHGFFQVFANVMVDTMKQPKKSTDAKFYNHLGDKVNLDTSDTKYVASILSGNYIICGMEHIWTANSSYSIAMQLVSDGINSAGQLNSYIATKENMQKNKKK